MRGKAQSGQVSHPIQSRTARAELAKEEQGRSRLAEGPTGGVDRPQIYQQTDTGHEKTHLDTCSQPAAALEAGAAAVGLALIGPRSIAIIPRT